jgi:hypothetical protein
MINRLNSPSHADVRGADIMKCAIDGSRLKETTICSDYRRCDPGHSGTKYMLLPCRKIHPENQYMFVLLSSNTQSLRRKRISFLFYVWIFSSNTQKQYICLFGFCKASSPIFRKIHPEKQYMFGSSLLTRKASVANRCPRCSLTGSRHQQTQSLNEEASVCDSKNGQMSADANVSSVEGAAVSSPDQMSEPVKPNDDRYNLQTH